MTHTRVLDAIARRTEPRDGHLLWTGGLDRGMPRITVGTTKYTVRPFLLREHLGRDIHGSVAPTCGEQLCVREDHLLDSVGRAEARAQGIPVPPLGGGRRRAAGPAKRPYQPGTITPGQIPAGLTDAFHQRLRAEGPHLVWTGAVEYHTPVVRYGYARYNALTLAWVLHHGTAPAGAVRIGCDTPLCVNGPCLTDEVLRQEGEKLVALLHGKTLTGACPAGHNRAEHASVRADGRIDCRACDRDRNRQWRRTTQAVAA